MHGFARPLVDVLDMNGSHHGHGETKARALTDCGEN